MERCRRWGSAAKPSFFTQTLYSPPFSSLLSVHHHHHLHASRQVTMNYKSAVMVNLVNLCIRLPISILSFAAASASIFNAVGLLCFLHLISFHFFFLRLTNCLCATTGTRRKKKIDRERRVCTCACEVWSIISREEKERCTLADLLFLSLSLSPTSSSAPVSPAVATRCPTDEHTDHIPKRINTAVLCGE